MDEAAEGRRLGDGAAPAAGRWRAWPADTSRADGDYRPAGDTQRMVHSAVRPRSCVCCRLRYLSRL